MAHNLDHAIGLLRVVEKAMNEVIGKMRSPPRVYLKIVGRLGDVSIIAEVDLSAEVEEE